MHLLNFAFSRDHIGVDYGERYLDLHNDFDFARQSKVSDELELEWVRSRISRVRASPSTFRITVAGVSYFEVRGKLSETLDEFGVFDNDTLGKVDYQGTTRAQDGYDLLVLRFVGGGELVVQGKTASASSDE